MLLSKRFSYHRNQSITASTAKQKLVIGFLAQFPKRKVTAKMTDVIQESTFNCLFPRNVYNKNSPCVVFLERCNIYHARSTRDPPKIIFSHLAGESDTCESEGTRISQTRMLKELSYDSI